MAKGSWWGFLSELWQTLLPFLFVFQQETIVLRKEIAGPTTSTQYVLNFVTFFNNIYEKCTFQVTQGIVSYAQGKKEVI